MASDVETIEVSKSVFTVQDFITWLESDQLELRPYFQRGSVWTPSARSYLIDSLLRGYPVPIIFLQTKRNRATLRAVRQVVDGQQRLRAVLGFVRPDLLPLEDGEVPVKISRAHNSSLAGATFEDLPEHLQVRLLDTELPVHTLPDGLPDAVLLQLFARLNSTGEKLTAQELRNARFHGEFKTRAYDLSYEHVPQWERWKLFSRQQIAKMRDVEFVSELMLVVLRGVEAKSAPALDKTYGEFDQVFPQGDFVDREMRRILAHLDEANAPGFEVMSSQSWVYAIFASLAKRSREALGLPAVLETRRSIQRLDGQVRDVSALPETLQKSLRGASTDRSSRETRVQYYESTAKKS